MNDDCLIRLLRSEPQIYHQNPLPTVLSINQDEPVSITFDFPKPTKSILDELKSYSEWVSETIKRVINND